MKKKKLSELHEKAIRLVEGGIVEVDGLMVKAIKAPIDENECDICCMDCLCHKTENTEMIYLCEQVEYISKDCYYLKIVGEK